MTTGTAVPPRAAEDGRLVAVSCRALTKRFGGTLALKGVDLDVIAGEVHALVGENGAGKSTLLGILSGRVAPTSGTVAVFGEPLQTGDPRASHNAGIAAIYQELTMVPALSAQANVFLGQTLSRGGILAEREMRRRFLRLCQELDVEIEPSAAVRELPVAQQQLLEIMRGLQANARIVLFDEPTAALAEHERESLYAIVGRLARQGVTVIFVSHNLDEVLRLSDTVTVLRNGDLIASKPKADWSKRELVAAMLGRQLQRRRVERAPRGGTPVLRAEGITLGGAIYDIALSVEHGEIVGLGGLVGSGRTSVMRCLAGMEPSSTGRLWIDGEAVRWPRSVTHALRLGIAMVPEDRKAQGLVLGMSVLDNITMSDFAKVSQAGFLPRNRQARVVTELAGRFGFDSRRGRGAVGSLSGGNQQKILLAKWVHRKPRVLLADEPTRGIDVGAKAEVISSLESLAAEGLGIVMASSELEEVVDVSDRVIVLAAGRIVGEFPGSSVTVGQILHAAFGVHEEVEHEHRAI